MLIHHPYSRQKFPIPAVIVFLASISIQAAPPVLPAPITQAAPAPPAGAFRSETSNPPTAPAVSADRSAEASIPTLMAGEGDYVLAAGDTLDLMVYKEPDLNMRSKIARDGRVQLPLLGEVAVAGKTVREAQDYIKKLLNDDYLVDPQVYLNVASYTQRKITLIGQVVRPGSYELQGNESLGILEAVGMAGGFTRIADSKNVTVKRIVGGKPDTIKINTKKLEDPKGGSFQVLPGDIITVGESWY